MFAGAPSVFAYTQPTDMRKSFAGLCGLVEQELGQTVESGHLFLLFNRRRNSVKVLAFVGDGLMIVYKRLEAGTFELPRALNNADSAAAIELRMSELALILEGIELASVRRRRRGRRQSLAASSSSPIFCRKSVSNMLCRSTNVPAVAVGKTVSLSASMLRGRSN